VNKFIIEAYIYVRMGKVKCAMVVHLLCLPRQATEPKLNQDMFFIGVSMLEMHGVLPPFAYDIHFQDH
jgi:hypothetical protein